MDTPTRDRLERLADELSANRDVLGLVAFGSAVRGDVDDRSDLDLLVVKDTSGSVREIRCRIRQLLSGSTLPVSVFALTDELLAEEFHARPSFAAHLQDESEVLYESPLWHGLNALLRDVSIDRDSLQQEVEERAEDLAEFERFEPFNGHFLTYLAHLYAIGRAIVIAKLLSQGVHEYSWRRIFERYAQLRPDLAAPLHNIEELRPYYEFVRARNDSPPKGVDVGHAMARRALESVSRIAGLKAGS